jgi:VanZ family protein
MKWLAVLFALFIIGIVVLADTDRLGPLGAIYGIPYGDKVGHFVLYGLLALFLNLAFLSRTHADPGRRVLTVSLTLAMLIGLEELSQFRFPDRTMDIADLLSGYAGVAIFSCIAYWVKT